MLVGDIPKKIKFQKEIKMIDVIEFDVEIIVLSGGV